ncbi:MAG: hypothetical protein QM564_04735 [Bergeyella sp.]
MKIKIFLFLLFASTIKLYSATDVDSVSKYKPLLHKPYKENVLGIHSMYKDLIDIKDNAQRIKKAEEIKAFARKNNDRRLELNVDFFLNFWSTFYLNQPKDVSLRKLKEQLELTTKENVDFLRARSLRALAEYYWKLEKNYELAFEQYLLLDNELAKINADDYPEMARDLMQIGEAYYYFQDYGIAEKYFKKAISLPENTFNTFVINTARNTLGLCYQQENKLDSSDYYFKKILDNTFPEAKVWKRIAIGNMGTNMYFRQRYDDAIALLETDFYGAVAENDYGCAAGAAISLADIYRSKGKMEQAKSFIDKAQEYIEKSGQKERLRLLYPVMSKWYMSKGDANRSKQYMDSTVVAINKYNERFSALKLFRAQQKIDLQKEKLRQSAAILEREKKIAERGLFLFLVVILCGATALIYFYQKKKQLSKDLKLQKAAQELETAKINLDRFTERILQKENLIEDLKQKLTEQRPETDSTVFAQMQQSTILTEEDWTQFKTLFEQVHSGFLNKLKEKYPQISPAETRFLSLAKLNFSRKEMASALGVSPQSIHTNWYRIRKKLDLPETWTVDELIETI